MNPRPELTPLPERMRWLPIDERGYPVPWFVEWVDGKPDFRIMDVEKWGRAVNERRCWVCGERTGLNLVFILGPMCAINRTANEPPSHYDCALWSAKNCPFLTRPRMVRREGGLPDEVLDSIGGIAIKRNPGCVALWICRKFKIFRPDDGGVLIRVGSPDRVEWYTEGRPATRAEVEASVAGGMVLLRAEAEKEEGGVKALEGELALARVWWPAA